jgi:hypothetical protein
VVVTSVVVTPMAGRDHHVRLDFGLGMRVPGYCRGCDRGVMGGAVRSSIISNRARGQIQKHEAEQGPEGKANAKRP